MSTINAQDAYRGGPRSTVVEQSCPMKQVTHKQPGSPCSQPRSEPAWGYGGLLVAHRCRPRRGRQRVPILLYGTPENEACPFGVHASSLPTRCHAVGPHGGPALPEALWSAEMFVGMQ